MMLGYQLKDIFPSYIWNLWAMCRNVIIFAENNDNA